MKKLYVLDAVNFLFRSYYAIGPMTNPKGESTGALYGFIRSIFKMIKEFSPDHLIAVFDGPESTKSRKEIYSDYKIHRAKMPDDLYTQLGQAQYFCKISGIPYLAIPGVEADDVIGSIAKWTNEKQIETYLCSSDKDLSQLVTDHVFVLNVNKNNLIMDRAKVKEIFGVFPEQIIDLLAMMGDASDNIPGLGGIGPKTAAELLNEFGTLNAILENPEKLKGKKGDIFREGKQLAKLSQQLATINTEVDFPKEDHFFRLKEPDLDKVKAFYQEMHFMTLLKELHLPDKKKEELDLDFGVDPSEVSYTLINDEQELIKLIGTLSSAKELCIDTETTSINPMEAQLVGIGICKQPTKAWYIPLNGAIDNRQVLAHLKPLLQNREIAFFGHNLKYDLHVLRNAGIDVKNIGFDTMLASYLIAPHRQRHGLDPLSLEYFGKVKIPITDLIGKGKNEISMLEVPLEQAAKYCCEDVDYTFRLKEIFEKEIDQKQLQKLFREIELPLLPVLLEMEERGIFLDSRQMDAMHDDLKKKISDLTQTIFSYANEEFNLNSPKQLGEVLFDRMAIRPAKKTTTGYSTSADVLEALQENNPIIRVILEYRSLEKLRSTYVDALPLGINPKTKRIHCTFNQSVTATGRLSCQDPNLQNIPVRSEEGRKIRSAFIPQQEGWSYLAGDYSQIELRLLAHLSDDPTLIQAFQEGEDIHSYTASLVYGVALADVDPKMRHAAKAVNFGILYGQQAFGLSKELGISIEEAKSFINTYFDRYKKVADYLESCKESARRLGYSTTLCGRKRPIPEMDNKNAFIRQAAERLAINTPLQGTAADLIKMAMIEIEKKLKPFQGYMILQIHDELIFELPDEEIGPLTPLVKNTMENVMKLKIPLVVDISIGKNWGEC
ncbi:MAG: DNA polymerase I [Verrucomicrobia bacterium]|nr:DNA polymerase I [Verrucomicrobiota bacterium]